MWRSWRSSGTDYPGYAARFRKTMSRTESGRPVAGVIAICPAGEDHLRRGLRAGRFEFRASPDAVAALDAWLSEHDLRDAVERVGTKPLLLIHARGDEQIPSEWSAELHRHALS